MANQVQGPVSPGTALRARGAQGMERAMGRMFSVGSDPATKAAYMQTSERRGQEAAQQIRMRYFKQEFEQILDLEVKPETDRLQEYFAGMSGRLQTSVMPVPYAKSPEEVAQRQDAVGMTEQSTEVIPGATTAEGKPGAPTLISRETPSQNAGFQGDALGVVEVKEQLAFMIDGKPVPVDSAEGIAYMQSEHSQMGLLNREVQTTIMDKLAKYAGNPYAAQYMDSMTAQLSKQAGQTATGLADPAEAVKFMEDRQTFDEKIETDNLAQRETELQNQRAMGNRAALVETARELVMRGRTPTGLSEKLAEKLRNGDELTELQAATVAQAQKLHIEQVNKNAANALKSGTGIKPMNEHNTEFWHGDLATGNSPTSQEYRQEYSHSMDDSSAQEERKFLTLGEKGTDRAARQKAQFNKWGIDPDEQANYWTTGEITEGIKAGLDADAAAGGSRQKAQGIAMVKVLAKLEHENSRQGSGEITRQVDAVLDRKEAEYWDRNNSLDRPFSNRSVQAKIDYMRKHRGHTFVQETLGVNLTRPEEGSFPVEYREAPLGVAPAMIDGEAGGGLIPAPAQAVPESQAAAAPSQPERTHVFSELQKAGQDYATGKNTPARVVYEAMEDAGMLEMNKAVWRGGKKFLNKRITMDSIVGAPQAFSDQIDYEWDMIKGGARSLYDFATTGSFSPSADAPITSSAARNEPDVTEIPQLDSFAKASRRQVFREGITAAGMSAPVAEAGERVHYRDRERRR